MHLRTKIIDSHPYLYAVENTWNAGSPKVSFQTYLGRADQLQGPLAKPLVRTFRFGAVAVLLQLAAELDVRATVNRLVASSGNPSVGDYILLAALNRAVKPRSKRAFAEWYETSSLKRLHPIPAKQLSPQRFWDAMETPASWLARYPEGQANSVVDDFAIHRQVMAELGWATR